MFELAYTYVQMRSEPVVDNLSDGDNSLDLYGHLAHELDFGSLSSTLSPTRYLHRCRSMQTYKQDILILYGTIFKQNTDARSHSMIFVRSHVAPTLTLI